MLCFSEPQVACCKTRVIIIVRQVIISINLVDGWKMPSRASVNVLQPLPQLMIALSTGGCFTATSSLGAVSLTVWSIGHVLYRHLGSFLTGGFVAPTPVQLNHEQKGRNLHFGQVIPSDNKVWEPPSWKPRFLIDTHLGKI